MGITKKFLNLFKSGQSEEEEQARRLAQKERYDNFLTALTEGDLETGGTLCDRSGISVSHSSSHLSAA